MALTINHPLNSISSGSGILRLDNTGAVILAKGTTGQRPGSPEVGMIRYNTTTSTVEAYIGASPAWTDLNGTGGGGGSSDSVVYAIALG